MLSWPRWRWITVSGTPAWIRQPALVCLRSWGLGLGAPRQPLPEQVNTNSVQHLGHCCGCRLPGCAIQVAVDLRRHRRVLMPEVG